MRPKFIPASGKMAVIREKASETWEGYERFAKTDDRVAYDSTWNPWATVIAIGDTYFEGDHEVECEFEEGDRVAIMRSGVELTLSAPNGDKQTIYALSWPGGLGNVTAVCEFCGHAERRADLLSEPKCANCGRETGSLIAEPTVGQVAKVKASKR